MTTALMDLLTELAAAATSKAGKGHSFELLIAAYLRTDPVYASQFSDVWLWGDWPGRNGKGDHGIDLVARDRTTGDLVAVQCKFFAPTSTVSKADIDSFLANSGKEGFAGRIIVSTTDRWNPNAENAIKDQQIPVRRVSVADLEASSVDWTRFSPSTPSVLPLATRNELRPHQQAAISNVVAGFSSENRGRLIMACGTGKTFTALRLAEQLVPSGGRVLMSV